MAIMCNDAAKEFVSVEEGFEIVGPVVKNSDIFFMENENPSVMGAVSNRKYQEELIKKYYPNAEVKNIIHNALPYSVESGLVDGGVMDVIKSIGLKGKKESCSAKGDFVTYVLVVNSSFKNTEDYNLFVELYNKSVDEMKSYSTLKKSIEKYRNIEIDDSDMEVIEDCRLEFLKIK